jgi:hypothetical protein
VWKLGLKHSIHDHCDMCDLRAIMLQDVWMGWYGGMVQWFWVWVLNHGFSVGNCG